MMSARGENSDRLFTSNEFLTGQQIASYFFRRLASKRALQSTHSSQSESAEAEMVLSDMRGEVLENV